MVKSAFRAVGLPFSLAAAGLAFAQEEHAPKASAASATATGTVKVQIVATTNPNITDGTKLFVNPTVRISDTKFGDTSYVYETATVKGGKVTYAVTIPYKWLVATRSNSVYVSVNLYGSFATGSASAYFTKIFALPANGTTTTVRFTGSI